MKEKIIKMDEENSGKGLIALLIVLILLLLSLIGYRYFFISVEVSGTSMNPTLSNGDMLVLNKAILAERGDIVVFNIEEKIDRQDYWIIKRVIGVEGDVIKIEDGHVYRKTNEDDDFVMLKEDYIQGITEARNSTTEWTVGEDEYFFLGDNRAVSLDSRFYGVRNKDDVVGVVTSWSIEQEGFWYKFNKIINYPSTWFASCNHTIGE